MIDRRKFLAMTAGTLPLLAGCRPPATPEDALPGGEVQILSEKGRALLDPQALIRMLADGFKWTEGPAWDATRGRLLFSDIPNNRIHSWSDSDGLGIFLDPAGRPDEPAEEHAAPGANGLLFDGDNTLLICNQDASTIDRLDITVLEKARAEVSPATLQVWRDEQAAARRRAAAAAAERRTKTTTSRPAAQAPAVAQPAPVAEEDLPWWKRKPSGKGIPEPDDDGGGGGGSSGGGGGGCTFC